MFLLAANKQNWVLIEEAKTIFIKVSNIFFWGGGGGGGGNKILCSFRLLAMFFYNNCRNSGTLIR